MPTPRLAWLSLICSLLLLAACAALQPRLERPSVSLVDVDLLEVGLLRQRYLITLSVQNPNSRSIPIKGMSYTLDIAGQDFASGVSPRGFTLPAYGESEVQVELNTNLLSTLRRLQDLLEGGSDSVSYALSGKLEVDIPVVGSLPFNNSGEIKLSL